MAAMEIGKEKSTSQIAKKLTIKNIERLAVQAAQAIPEKKPALTEDFSLGFNLFKF